MLGVQSLEVTRWGDKALPGQDELPCSDGEPLETAFHVDQNALLNDALYAALAGKHDYYIGSNMFVYFSEQQIRSNDFRGPDIFVVLDVDAKKRKSWVAWKEGSRLPDIVIEVTSESTADVDRGEKMRIYSQIWHTGAYFIFDPDTERLEGYRLDDTGRRYVPLEPDANGDLDVAALGLKLGLRDTSYRGWRRRFLRLIDVGGEPVRVPSELVDAERQRADAERQRADAERQRAEAEQQRADAERQRADALEAELRELRTK